MKKHTLLLKIVAVILIFTLLVSDCYSYAGSNTTPLWNQPTAVEAQSADDFDIPAQWGRIVERHRGHNGRTVIYIQDAHTSLEAQKNIARMIRHLVDKRGVPVVFEEGYQGDVPSDRYFRSPLIRSDQLRKEISWFLLDHLRIGGAEFAHINRKRDFRLVGVEDNRRYKACLRQYLRAAIQSKAMTHNIRTIQRRLSVLETQLFPSPFYKWWKIRQGYLRGEVPFPDYVLKTVKTRQTPAASGKAASDVYRKRYPALVRLYSELTQSASAETIGTVNSSEGPMPDPEKLFSELARFERSLVRELLRNKNGRKLYFYLNAIEVLAGLARLEIGESEYERYQKDIAPLKTRDVLKFLGEYGKKPVLLSSYWEQAVREMSDFYESARSRDVSLQKHLRSGHWNKAVLVFGGFHKKGILQTLRAGDFSYVVVAPRMSGPDPVHERRYRALMSGKIYAFETRLWPQNAVKAMSVYFAGVSRWADFVSAWRARSGAVSMQSDPAGTSPRGEIRTGPAALPYFDLSLDLETALKKLSGLLRQAAGDAAVLTQICQAWQEYLAQTAKVSSDDLRSFFEKLFPILEKTWEPEFLQYEAFIQSQTALEKNPLLSGHDLKQALSLPDLKISRRARRMVSESFYALKRGRFQADALLFRPVRYPDFEDYAGVLRTYSPEGKIKKLRKLFNYETGELQILLGHLFHGTSPQDFLEADWRRLYEAMAYENTMLEESRFGGFRRAAGVRRWLFQKPEPLALMRPPAGKTARRIEEVFGIRRETLDAVTGEVFGLSVRWNDLKDRERSFVYERLNGLNKQRFGRLDASRYALPGGRWQSLRSAPARYRRIFHAAGTGSFLVHLLNGLLSLIIGFVFRLPLRCLDFIFLRYFRSEILYEKKYGDRDFLGATRSEFCLRQALSDLREKRFSLRDRLRMGLPGVINRGMDRYLAGNLLKAALKTALRLLGISAIGGIPVGLVMLLMEAGRIHEGAFSLPMPWDGAVRSGEMEREELPPARGKTSLLLQDTSNLLTATVYDLMNVPPDKSVQMLTSMSLTDLTALSEEAVKPRHQLYSGRWAALLELLKTVSPERYAVMKLSGEAQFIRQGDSEENRDRFIESFRSVADQSKIPDRKMLRAVAVVLDQLEPELMSALLISADRPEFLRAVLAEAPFVTIKHKERLFELAMKFGAKTGAPVSGIPVYGTAGTSTQTGPLRLPSARLATKRASGLPSSRSVQETADRLDLLLRYEQQGDHAADRRSEIDAGYRWLSDRQMPNGAFRSGTFRGLNVSGSTAGNGHVTLEIGAGLSGSEETIVSEGEAPGRQGFAVEPLDVRLNGQKIFLSGLPDGFETHQKPGQAVITARSADPEGKVTVVRSDSLPEGRDLSVHESVVNVRESGNYEFQSSFRWLPSRHEDGREPEGGIALWFPGTDETMEMSQLDEPQTLDITARLKSHGAVVVYGEDKGIILRVNGPDRLIANVSVTTRRSGKKIVIDQIRFTYAAPQTPAGASVELPAIQAAGVWVPLAAVPLTLGGEGRTVPDDLLAVVPRWLAMAQKQNDDDGNYSTDQGYVSAGKVLFKTAAYYDQLAVRATADGQEEQAKRYRSLSAEARRKGLQTAEYAWRVFRTLLHQDRVSRSYSGGSNYPEMIELFDEAYQATRDREWYLRERHVAQNLLANEIRSSRQLFPEYRETEMDRPYLILGDETVDLFEAVRHGTDGYHFRVNRRTLAPFEVGYNEELARTITESSLEVIADITVEDAGGHPVDRLIFEYNEQGILTKIQSEKDRLVFRKTSAAVVDHVTVYQNNQKGIPYGLSYRYVYSPLGELQYIIQDERITIVGTMQTHPVHNILKGTGGRVLKDLDIPQGLRPDFGSFRQHEGLDSVMEIGAMGRTLRALHRFRFRAENEEDWVAAADCSGAATDLIRVLFDHEGDPRVNAAGLFYFYGDMDPDSGRIQKRTADASDQAALLSGLAAWIPQLEQARELYLAGHLYFQSHDAGNLPEDTADLLADAELQENSSPAAGRVSGMLELQAAGELGRYIRYGEKTANFKFVRVQTRRFKIEEHQADALLLSWEPVAEAHWYLVREYQKNAQGHWEAVPLNDKWVTRNYMILEETEGEERRFVVAAFTADPIFETYGPYFGVKSFSSEAVTTAAEGDARRPGPAHLKVMEGHRVSAKDEWIDLSGVYEISASEFKQQPLAAGDEWEIATDRDFRHVVKRFEADHSAVPLYVKGLPDGDYYVRLRFWSGARQDRPHDWLDLGALEVGDEGIPGPVVNEDLNGNGVRDEREPDGNKNGVFDRIFVRDDFVIEWSPSAGANYYRVAIWYQDGDLARFRHEQIIARDPFINVRLWTTQPVNRIEIVPYSAHPELGGVAGSPSGAIAVETIQAEADLSPMANILFERREGENAITWQPVSGASIYEIDICSGARDQEVLTRVWSGEFATAYRLNHDAKFLRMRAWTDSPGKGGRPLTDYSEWVETDVELGRPERVDKDTLQLVEGTDADGRATVDLTFESVPGVAGYWVRTQNRRGGSYVYWVEQPSETNQVRVPLVMDADSVRIESTTDRIHGRDSNPTTAFIQADIQNDNWEVPFVIEDSSFDYDLSAIPSEGMRVYIQYATQYRNEAVHEYSPAWGNRFRPSRNADRVWARIVRISEDGRKIVSDWTKSREAHIRVDAPPQIPSVKAAEPSNPDSRTVEVPDMRQETGAHYPISGYHWETRMDLNDPAEEAEDYRSRVRTVNGVCYDPATKIELSGSARWIRVKAVAMTPAGEIESEEWSDWQAIEVHVDEPAPVENVRLVPGNKLVYDPHPDERVNAYRIELSDNPYDTLSPVHAYTQRAVHEDGKMIEAGNEFQIPLHARYVRVRPVIYVSETDEIHGASTRWIPIQTEGVHLLPRVTQSVNDGHLLIGSPVEGANYYRFETIDRLGRIREYWGQSPWTVALTSYTGFRMQAIRGREKSGELVVENDGEWTDWQMVDEVAIQEVRTPPLHFATRRATDILYWDAEYASDQERSLGIPKDYYVVELEDGDGNRILLAPGNTQAVFLTHRAVRARIKARLPSLGPQQFGVVFKAESEWSPWLSIQPQLRGMEHLRPHLAPDGTVRISPVEGASLYTIDWVLRSGEFKSVTHDQSVMERLGWTLRFKESDPDPAVKLRVRISGVQAEGLAIPTTPEVIYDWVDFPGRQIEPLAAPKISNGKPVLPEDPYVRGKLELGRIGLDSDGNIYFGGVGYDDGSGWKGPGSLPPAVQYLGYDARDAIPSGAGWYRQSPVSALVPLHEPSGRQSQMPPAMPPQMTTVVSAGILEWPQVAYEVTVSEMNHPEKVPAVLVSPDPYPPAALLPLGRDAYDVTVRDITAFEVELTTASGEQRILRVAREEHDLNLGDLPQDTYASVHVRYVTQSGFYGNHGKWSMPRALRVHHPGNEGGLLYVRGTSDEILTAVFSDGTETDYRVTDRALVRAVIPGKGEVAPEDVPEKYRLAPEEVFERGECWVPIAPGRYALRAFFSKFQPRNMMSNKAWSAELPKKTDLGRPTQLLGLSGAGVLHVDLPQGRRSLEDSAFVLNSKEDGGANPGAVEARWSSAEGVEIYSRQYLALNDSRGAVTDLSLDSSDPAKRGTAFVLALELSPSQSLGSVRTERVGDYLVVWFASGQFAAVRQDRLAGWYLGPDGRRSAENPENMNGISRYDGTAERAVLYLRGTLGHPDTKGVYEPVTGNGADRLFIFTGLAADDAELSETLSALTNQVNRYEAAIQSLSDDGSQTGIFPGDFFNYYFVDVLQNTAWNAELGTYWEMVGSGIPEIPCNTLRSNAVWSGNSSLMAQLDVDAYRLLMSTRGHDVINAQGEQLLRDRILPNADWIAGMQTPTGSFYMKNADAMRFYSPEGMVMLDNQQISAIVSLPEAIVIRRGYEPLDGCTIAGSGFSLRTGDQPADRRYNIHDPRQFSFQLPLPADIKIDPQQPELSATRVFTHRSEPFRAEEQVTLERGEYGLRYRLALQANESLDLQSVSVAMSYLDADQDIEINPNQFPGFPGENSLMIAGMARPYRASDLFQLCGLTEQDKGQWIDLLDLFRDQGKLTEEGEAIRRTLQEVGAVGIAGWDKQGLLYLPRGIDYGKGYRVMVKIGESPDDHDWDHLIEFTDLRLEIPVEESKRHLENGERYESPTVHFTNFWVRLGVVDHRHLPEDLKHMMHDWIAKIDGGVADGLSLESDYAYNESVIALWNTASLMLDQTLAARRAGNELDEAKYAELARKYALSAMRGTVSSRDADRSFYDEETGLVRTDIMNSKGVMRFYGTYTVVYSAAADFMWRLRDLEREESLNIFGGTAGGRTAAIYDALYDQAQARAGQWRTAMESASSAKERLRAQAHWEIAIGEEKKIEVLRMRGGIPALEQLVQTVSQSLPSLTDPLERTEAEILMDHAGKQMTYLRSMGQLPESVSEEPGGNYWFQETVFGADRILELQELNDGLPTYGGFYQNEQPSKMQLDDNGTKLWALRVAYDEVGREIDRILKAPGFRSVQLERLTRLYQRRAAYLRAAEINITFWLRNDEQDGHLYGWESVNRQEDYDSQRTPYGWGVSRLGLAAWMDCLPEARKKFDRSSRMYDRPDSFGARMLTPEGVRINRSADMSPGNGGDVSTEVAAISMSGFLARARGGSVTDSPQQVRMTDSEEPALLAPASENKDLPTALKRIRWHRWLAVLQLFLEWTLISGAAVAAGRILRKGVRAGAVRLTSNPFFFYNLSILAMTVALVAAHAAFFNLTGASVTIVILVVAGAAYLLRNIPETLVRYSRIGVPHGANPSPGEPTVAGLDPAPFRLGAAHLSAVVTVPLRTTSPADANVSHGMAGEGHGAFQNLAATNRDPQGNLLFHINDNSPDATDSYGFNPVKFHADYVREMNARDPRRPFFYTRQPPNEDRKFGIVQEADLWWYGLRGAVKSVLNDLWDQLEADQKTGLERAAYGLSQHLSVPPGETAVLRQPESFLVIRVNANGTVDLSVPGEFARGALLAENLTLPAEKGSEIFTQLRVPRHDGLTALVPVWIRRHGSEWIVYHYNEDPDGENVTVAEVAEGVARERVGLLPREKADMIEEEARTVLYRFWATAYGGTNAAGDDRATGTPVTSGRAALMNDADLADVRAALETGGKNADELFLGQGYGARFSEAMVHQSVDYFSRVHDIPVAGGLNLRECAAAHGMNPSKLFPAPFDSSIQAWTDIDISHPPENTVSVPFDFETGKRAVPGQYFRLNSEGSRLEVYENPTLRMMDKVALYFEALNDNQSLSARDRSARAKAFLRKANPVLRRITKLAPVKIDYRVDYDAVRGQTIIVEERWLMYQYRHEDGSAVVFFKPERIIRFDRVVGHIPTVGPRAMMWRFDNDDTADLAEGERGTLSRGRLIAGHPRYLPVTDPNTNRAISGYGGMVLPLEIGDPETSLWASMSERNRRKAAFDLTNQWLNFGEVQYTGKGIEHIEMAAAAKAYQMSEGMYLSHDMRESGEYDGKLTSFEILQGIKEQGLWPPLLQGRRHPRFAELEQYVREHFRSKECRDCVVFRRYGRPMSTEAFLEELAWGLRGGGMGLLEGLHGYEPAFESLEQEWKKTQGSWKRGDSHWFHDGMGGIDIRGLSRLPGASPGWTTSFRRTMEQAVHSEGGNLLRIFIGQLFRRNPLNDAQKYYITRTFEEDQGGALMFVWVLATLIFAAFSGAYTLLNLWLFAYLLYFGCIATIIGVMKFSDIFSGVRRDGLTFHHTRQLVLAVSDTLLETSTISGLNLWKSLKATCELVFRTHVMKWIYRAQLKSDTGAASFLAAYTTGILLGLTIIAFVIALHPTMAWLIFGSLFLVSLIIGPFLARIAGWRPRPAKIVLGAGVILAAAAGILCFVNRPESFDPDQAGRMLMSGAYAAGQAAGWLLAAGVILRISVRVLRRLVQETAHAVRSSPGWLAAGWAWLSGCFLMLRRDGIQILRFPVEHNLSAVHELRRLRLSSIAEFLITRGMDTEEFLPNRVKAFTNLLLLIFIWALPLIFPKAVLFLALGSVYGQVVISGAYLGLFLRLVIYPWDLVMDPLRPFKFYNPADWLRAAFHLMTGSAALVLILLRSVLQTSMDALKMPYYWSRYRRFMSARFTGSADPLLAMDAAMVLKYGTADFRKRSGRFLRSSKNGTERMEALISSGIMDERKLRDLTDGFEENLLPESSRAELRDSPGLSASSLVQPLDLDDRFLQPEAEQESVGSSGRVTPDGRAELVSDIQGLKGAVTVDASSLSLFTPGQKNELRKTALSGRAHVILCSRGLMSGEDRAFFKGIPNMRLIREPLERSAGLLAGYPKVAYVFAGDQDPRLGMAAQKWEQIKERIVLFHQDPQGREGVVTAALLKIQYGDKYSLFKEVHEVNEMTDSTWAMVIREFLGQEMVYQSA